MHKKGITKTDVYFEGKKGVIAVEKRLPRLVHSAMAAPFLSLKETESAIAFITSGSSRRVHEIR